ncbi:uncharacterized protein LOC125488063 isoform X2 [Rhincodon typus]|uniref:uncharacterized protein LOC125488063 isoform X2 n=1 Tax=Rhincodon typus TaxID=259920 RepID=UPI00202FEA88|nr:uncharacterized protein LOC125488063 isoform X2 [Rhincodon typus]
MQVLTGNLIKSQITASLAFSQEINSIVICNSVLVISFQTLSMSEMSIKSTDQVGSTSGIPLKNPDPIGSKSGISIKIPDQIGSKSGISIKIPDQIGSKSGISFGRPDQIGSKSRISLQRPDQIGSKSGISLKRPDQISSKSGISLKRPDQTGSRLGLDRRSLSQLPEFRNVSTLYLETVEEEGNCLRLVNSFFSRELKIFGITEIMIGITQVVFGIPLNFTETYIFAVLMGIPWWTGVLYIAAGSLVVDIINTANINLKQAIILMHIVSCVAAMVGTGVYLISLNLMEPLNSSFYFLGPLMTVFFLLVLCFLEFIIAFIILFLHCSVLTQRLGARRSHVRFRRPR